MNVAVVRKLIAKDLFFGRWILAAFLGVGLLALVSQAALLSSESVLLRVIALVLFYGVLNGLIWVPIPSVVGERRAQTLSFLMSLPVTIGEFTAAKVLSNVLQFGAPWLILGGSAVVFILSNARIADSYALIVVVLLVQLLTYFVLMLCVALVIESHVLASMTGIASNVVYWLSWSFLGVAPGFGVSGPDAMWLSTGRPMLIGHLAAIPLILLVAFYFQSRKRDFL